MNRPYRRPAAVDTPASLPSQAAVQSRIAGSSRQAEKPSRDRQSLMRKFEVSVLLPDGELRETHHIAPAMPLFENCASAFARGTLIQTAQGPVAVEDLLPGDKLECVDGPPQRLRWIGSTMIVPQAPGQSDCMTHLVRVMADSMGLGRPMPDLMLGPAARILHERHAHRRLTGKARLFLPVVDFMDGNGVVRITPPTPVRVYHLLLDEHAAIRAAGLEFESYHPGENALSGLGENMRALFMSLFPQLRGPEDFGPLAWPRATQEMLDNMSAA